MNTSDNPLSFKNLLAGVIVAVIGGVILAYIIQDARFSPKESTPETVIPTSTPSDTPTQSLGKWIITVGKYASVELAKSDATNYTSKGYHVEIFCRVSEVTPGGTVEIRAAVVGFETEEAVNLEAPNVWNINPYGQIKPLDLWCPNLTSSGDYISCNYNTCP